MTEIGRLAEMLQMTCYTLSVAVFFLAAAAPRRMAAANVSFSPMVEGFSRSNTTVAQHLQAEVLTEPANQVCIGFVALFMLCHSQLQPSVLAAGAE